MHRDRFLALLYNKFVPPLNRMAQIIRESLIKYDPPMQADAAREKVKRAQQAQSQKTTAAAEDILNSLLQPREFEQDGEKWVQFVSSQPATRLDVLNL